MKELIYFSIGKPKKMEYGDNKEIETGICKETVEDALLTKDGFIGDGVANTKFHGGPDRAVCVYPYEHYSLWEKEFGQKLPPSAFGENVTVTNMLEKDVHVGDVFQLGEAVIQVTQGRIPCSTISKRNNNDPLLKIMVETGYTGYLCRVLQEGKVRKGSSISLLEAHPKQLSVLFGNELYFHRPSDVEGMKRMLEVEELAEVWKEKLRNRINAAMS
ncbi:MOSC domain-containing protein [Sutcliffiella cohnii]|uniref:MOSC domain-containing protein n=1 Tax=Sutcliffiella cohnii TaxID=33932 RepID=UPI002E1A4D23|nr:MOSC domain-containing protein [Sutcliffiella cohnii]